VLSSRDDSWTRARPQKDFFLATFRTFVPREDRVRSHTVAPLMNSPRPGVSFEATARQAASANSQSDGGQNANARRQEKHHGDKTAHVSSGGETNDQPVLCASHLRLFEAELEKKNMTTKGITWDPRLVVLSADRISFAKVDDEKGIVRDYIPLHEVISVEVVDDDTDGLLTISDQDHDLNPKVKKQIVIQTTEEGRCSSTECLVARVYL